MMMGQAGSSRKELICSRDDAYRRENFGIDSANPLKHASRSACSWTKRQSITPFAGGGFARGFGGIRTAWKPSRSFVPSSKVRQSCNFSAIDLLGGLLCG